MKLTTMKILEANEALVQLGQLDNLPISTSVKIAHLYAKIEAEAKPFMELRNKLILKHGEKNKETQEIRVPEKGPKAIAFAKEINEFLVQEIEVDVPKIKLPDEEYCKEKGVSIKPAIIKALLDFIEEV